MKILTAYKHVRRFWWSRQFGIIVILCILLVSLLRDRSSLLLLTKHSTSTTISGTVSTKNSLVTRQQGGSSPSSSYQQQQHLIHLNTNSSYVSSDIVKIVHKPKEEYQIEIHLKKNNNNNNNNNNRRQCQNPIYIGRISGSSLSIINFANFDYKKNRTQNKYNNTDTDNDNDNDNSMNNVIIGKYDLSTTATIANANANANKSGIYYIEILILLCEEPNYWNDDLYKVCLKDSNIPHTRITSSPATININNIDAVVDTTTAAIITKEINENQISTTSMTVTAAVPAAAGGSKSQSGRWLHTSFIEEERKNRKRRHEEDDDDDDHDTDLSVSLLLPQPQPLYTRYQPKGCMESEKYFKSTKNTTECLAAVDLSPFSSYKFVWDDPYMNRPFLPVKYLVQQKQNNNMNDEDNNNNNNNRAIPPTHVCFVGLSHSGTLVKKCNSLLKRHMKTKKKKNYATSVHDDDDDEADDINNDDVLPFQLKCSHIQVKFPFQIIRGGPPDSPNDDYQYTNTNTNTNTTTTMTHQEQQAITKEQNIRRRHQQQKVWVHENLIQPKCTHVVIGLYQWPFSLYQTEISSQLFFNEWKNDLKNVIKIITRNSKDKMKIILRSVHTNGLKEHILTCPAIDFRTPYNTIICNQILQDIVTDTNNSNNNNTTTTSKGSGIITTTNSSSSNDDDGNDSIISYINTNFITEPVWDSKEDWSHLRGEAGTEEIKYILYEILRQHK
ncbi:MAG: hypothetical protein ACI90V_004614 [Bacillariaceae sp.]|jgi:hypothetical protein